MFETLLTEIRDNILLVTLNRPEKLNALNRKMLSELAEVVNYAATEIQVRAVILTGKGEKAFVAGADIAEFSSFSQTEGESLARTNQDQVFNAIENSKKPWIAAINGYALGGGLELALACHLRIASDNVRLGLPELSLGLIPGYGGTQRLTLIVGRAKSLEMILCGKSLNALESLQFNLISNITVQSNLLEKAFSIAEEIKLRAPLAISAAITAVNAASMANKRGFEVEIAGFSSLFSTEDFKEGTRAFLEKRKANFLGR